MNERDSNFSYEDVKNELYNFEDGKFKNIILTKEDIKIDYGFLIFDVENKDKNKTLDAIAMCKNLGKSYYETCLWLAANTHYYPGTMRIELKLFVIDKKNNFALVFNPKEKEDYIIPFSYIENKEDGIVQAISLKNNNDKILFSNLFYAFEEYFDKEAILIDFRKKSELIFDELSKIEISQ